jgi:hypothetical protein
VIEGGDHAGFLVAESVHDAGEVVGRDADVGIVNEQEIVLGVDGDLDEGGDFAVGSERLLADDEADGERGEFLAEALDDRDGGVVVAGDSEEDFEGAGIILAAVAGEGFIHAVVDSAERFEDADGGCEGREVGGGAAGGDFAADVGAGSPEGGEVVDGSAGGERDEGAGDDEGERLKEWEHERLV